MYMSRNKKQESMASRVKSQKYHTIHYPSSHTRKTVRQESMQRQRGDENKDETPEENKGLLSNLFGKGGLLGPKKHDILIPIVSEKKMFSLNMVTREVLPISDTDEKAFGFVLHFPCPAEQPPKQKEEAKDKAKPTQPVSGFLIEYPEDDKGCDWETCLDFVITSKHGRLLEEEEGRNWCMIHSMTSSDSGGLNDGKLNDGGLAHLTATQKVLTVPIINSLEAPHNSAKMSMEIGSREGRAGRPRPGIKDCYESVLRGGLVPE